MPLGIAVALEFTAGPLAVAMFSRGGPSTSSGGIGDCRAVVPAAARHGVGIGPFGAACAGAGACWAVYIIFGQKAGGDHGPGTVALGSLIAALVFLPDRRRANRQRAVQLDILPVALAVAILSTALPYSLEIIALPKIPARTFGTLMSLGTGNGGAVRHAVPRRTPERRAMAGAGGHHRRVYGPP